MDDEMKDAMGAAQEIAAEVVDAFTKLHPQVRMNYSEWGDLREMIFEEALGHYLQNVGADGCSVHSAVGVARSVEKHRFQGDDVRKRR